MRCAWVCRKRSSEPPRWQQLFVLSRDSTTREHAEHSWITLDVRPANFSKKPPSQGLLGVLGLRLLEPENHNNHVKLAEFGMKR